MMSCNRCALSTCQPHAHTCTCRKSEGGGGWREVAEAGSREGYLAAEVRVQPRKMYVEMVKLRLVVHEDPELVGLHPVGRLDRLAADAQDAPEERQVLRAQVA